MANKHMINSHVLLRSASQDLQESAAITGGIAEQLQSEGCGHLDAAAVLRSPQGSWMVV